MFKNILEGVQGIDVYGIFSLVIFFVFFIVMVVWLMRVNKSYLKDMSNLPLHDEEHTQNQTAQK